MIKRLRFFLKEFAEEARGSVLVEAAIILPVLFWAYVAMIVFFDAYKSRSMSEKAAFTISDMLSREVSAIDLNYLTSAHNLFDILAKSQSATGLRVTVVSYSGTTMTYTMQWSQTRGLLTAYSQADLDGIVARLPKMADGETLVLVETKSIYNPPLNVGLGDLNIETFIFTRPRFAPQLVWQA